MIGNSNLGEKCKRAAQAQPRRAPGRPAEPLFQNLDGAFKPKLIRRVQFLHESSLVVVSEACRMLPTLDLGRFRTSYEPLVLRADTTVPLSEWHLHVLSEARNRGSDCGDDYRGNKEPVCFHR